MAQAYIKLKKILSYWSFLEITAISRCQCAANIRPKKLFKSSASLSFPCDKINTWLIIVWSVRLKKYRYNFAQPFLALRAFF